MLNREVVIHGRGKITRWLINMDLVNSLDNTYDSLLPRFKIPSDGLNKESKHTKSNKPNAKSKSKGKTLPKSKAKAKAKKGVAKLKEGKL